MTLDARQIADRLPSLEGWQLRERCIEKTFDCRNFDGSISFVNAVATLANAHDHHPDIAISWNDVTLSLTSHDIDALSERDFRLAAAIDALPRSEFVAVER